MAAMSVARRVHWHASCPIRFPDVETMDSSVPTSEAQASQLSIVGIGASAGGLESLERLFRALPASPGMAFVVIQHLSPDFKSLMDELMARYTDLSVRRAQHGDQVLADHVYLLPPGKELEIQDGRLWLSDRPSAGGLNLPIDRFFISLADEAGDRAVVVILSGTGSDGSRGAKRVHELGGVVLVEDPNSARFDGMPNAAIQADVADLVMTPEGLATALAGRAFKLGAEDRESNDYLGQIFSLLRTAFSIDFSQYKVSTVLRRIQRRVDLRNHDTLKSYVARLHDDPNEISLLGHDLLIGVTQFFRDAAAWRALESEVLPRLVAEADINRGLRAWVTGCASGEEAYSLGMLVHEEVRRSRPSLPIKIFASDVHRGAIERAGHGIFTDQALRNVSAELRERYFAERSDGALQVVQSLRHSIVFAHHNILRSAPFTSLDLATCRNMLIYFRPPAQDYVLSMLSYGMRVGGALMLGSSEGPGASVTDFEPLDEAQRIFLKVRSSRRVPLLPASRMQAAVAPEKTGAIRREQRLLGYYDAVLDHVMPPAFLLDDQRELLNCFGGSERLLQMRKRRPSQDIIDMVPEHVRLPLAGALSRAAKQLQTVRFHSLQWAGADEVFDLEISLVSTAERTQAFLILLHPPRHGQPLPQDVAALDTDDITHERVHDLELQLEHARENLQATVEELETSNEEMQATNEELVAANEELQSSNEELQSVNEELHTVNVEHQSKIREVSEINADMRQLLESTGEAIVLLDARLCIRRFTSLASSLFNLLPQDVGRPLTNFRHPLHYPDLIADIARCQENRETVEKYVTAADGGYYLVRVSAYSSDGASFQGVVLTIRDLSALREAQKQVELLSSIVATSRDAVIALDPKRRIIVWNDAASSLYGYAASEVMGSAFDVIVPPARRGELDEIFSAVAPSEPRETARLHKNGSELEVSSNCSPMYDPDGRISAYSVIERDISERKRRERRLEERERLLTDLFNHSPDMLVSTDVRSGMLLEVNETFRVYMGYSAQEAKELHFSQLYAQESQAQASRNMEVFRATGELRDVEMLMQRKDGSTFEVSLSATGLRDEHGLVTRSRAVLRDISERKRAERQMAAAAQMRERFMAMVSHELRTPMHAIRSASEVLNDKAMDAGQREQALQIVQRQSGQMTRLLDDLLDVARITSDKLELAKLPHDIRDAVNDAALALRGRFADRGVRLIWERPDAALPILGDAARLQQVITNLLNNSLRHCERGGRVEIKVARDEGSCSITVVDDGEGIEPTQLSRIFELFAQAPQSIARELRGLGLGLSISQRIIAAHGGTLIAHSDGKGRGATFTITLPINAGITLQEERAMPREHLSIVLVEDQDDSREMLQLVLEKRGHEVLTACDGREGLRVILSARPDVALIDIGLPVMDGYELASAVRAELAGSVKLVALTGYGQPTDVKRSNDAGFDRHVTKPLATDKLERILRELMGG
jgi:two-component system, chemotaxis family, CheB/CheR fusion protein